MRELSSYEVVQIWDWGRERSRSDREAALVMGGTTAHDLARAAGLGQSQRDSRLLDLSDRMLGGAVAGTTECATCAERVEFEFRTGDLRASAGDVALSLNCVACDSPMEWRLDLAEAVWSELSAEARRLMGEVHTLAERYGWTEQQVLELGAGRRGYYLQLIRER